MATYSELFTLSSDATLRNKIAVAIAIKAQTYIDSATPTTDQLTWASQAIRNPLSEASKIINYVLAANNELTVAQIQAATDASIQSSVDGAVDALVSGGITN